MVTARSKIRDRVDRFLRRGEERLAEPEDPLAGLSHQDAAIISRVLPYTMTSVARIQATIDAVRYCVVREIPGAFAECGVWRGGSILAMILTLQELGREDRDIYLFDTFEGMTEPTEHDTSRLDPPALITWQEAAAREEGPWDELFSPEIFDEASVRETVLSSGYPGERVHLCRGAVEETLPERGPPELSLLRLDTDWYESTLHELKCLYPRLADGAVIIIDDYGHWDGAKRAVDEYFNASAPPILLNRIDYTGRIGIKG